MSDSYKGNWLKWNVRRKDRTFRVAVVEPKDAEVARHSAIFWGTLTSFVPSAPKDLRLSSEIPSESEPWQRDTEFSDLVTFPEAFLPSRTLVDALKYLEAREAPIGCIHAGLRPDSEDKKAATHLFPTSVLIDLVAEIGAISPSLKGDLRTFGDWVRRQGSGDYFNVAALFSRDVENRLRICIHPKLVRSNYEVRLQQEQHMTEADLLSLVTLVPDDPRLLSVTIQPVICSDILRLSVDSSRALPIEAITSDRGAFEEAHAEHVDLVSVAAYTPNKAVSGGVEWHQEFRSAFQRASAEEGCSRHRFAAFILANYQRMQNRPAGLSGVFFPLPLFGAIDPERETATKTVFGHFDGDDEHESDRWVAGSGERLRDAAKAGLGYIVALREEQQDSSAIATLFSFTLTRLPRDANRWSRTGSVAKMSVRNGYLRESALSHEVVFDEGEAR